MTSVIRARGLALGAARGPVYGPIEVTADGPMGVITGPRGSGKTCLLLTLAGRMRASEGELSVLGAPASAGPRALQNQSAIAGFEGIDDLEEAVSVGDAVTERARWNAPWYARVRAMDDDAVRRALAPAFREVPIPAAKTMIWDLDTHEKLLLRIGLALMDRPRLLLVDNVDRVSDLRAQRVVIENLAELAHGGTAVIVSAAAFEPALFEALPVEPWVLPAAAPAALRRTPVSVSDTAEEQHA